MSGAIATAAIIGGASLAGAGISAYGAHKAADAQSSAAMNAAQLQYKASQDALGFQKQQWQTQQDELQPWLKSGQGALSNLDFLLGIGPNSSAQASTPQHGAAPVGGGSGFSGSGYNSVTPQRTFTGNTGQPFNGQYGNVPYHRATAEVNGTNGPARMLPSPGQLPSPTATNPALGPAGVANTVTPSEGGYGSLMTPYGKTFEAPTALTEQNDPGYQARLNLGTDAVQRSAAARGGILTGGTAKGLNQFAQDYASNEYGNVYNRAFNTFSQGYNQYNQGQTDKFNRLAAMSGIGQQTASQLGYLGNQSVQGITNNLLGTAQGMGNAYQNAGAANASGYVGMTNAINGGIGGAAGSLSNYYMLQQLLNGNNSTFSAMNDVAGMGF